MAQIKFCPKCGTKLPDKIKHCPECGFKLAGDNINHPARNHEKRNKVLQSGKKNNKNIYWLGAAALVLAVTIFIYNRQPSKEYSIIKDQPRVTSAVSYPPSRYDESITVAFAREDKIILPLDLVKDKKMVKFDYVENGEKIPILAYLSEDGRVITAISMCEPCNSTDFHIRGSNLVCNSCGTTWNLNDLDPVSGSCSRFPPDPVPSSVVGNEIQIDKIFVSNWRPRA